MQLFIGLTVRKRCNFLYDVLYVVIYSISAQGVGVRGPQLGTDA